MGAQSTAIISTYFYRHQWRIRKALKEYKKLVSEINTKGKPPATLFAFSLGLVAYMVVLVLNASLKVYMM